MADMKVLRSWQGGPLMEFSGRPHPKQGKWTEYHTYPNDPERQYSRNYICDECRRVVLGLYEPKLGVGDGTKWLCSDCRNAATPKQVQPQALRRK